MPRNSVDFEATPNGLELTAAILIYQAGASRGYERHYHAENLIGPAFASIHDIEQVEGQPTIAAGRPLSRANLRHWTEALGRTAAPEVLPDNVLVAHSDMLAWWVPEKVRMAYFALSTPSKSLRALAQRTSVPLPYPAHLFVATRRGLGVYALPQSKRPSASTPLLYSPVLNVFINGQLCWGNIPRPRGLTPAAMADFEAAVFDSWSTHPNPGQEASISGKGGLVRLWDDLAASKARRFPVKRLRPFRPEVRGKAPAEPINLGQLIARTPR